MSARALKAPALTETEFQTQVVELARLCGWHVNHTRRSIGRGGRWTTATSIVGWPDLTLYRTGELLFAELKTDTGKVTPEQAQVHTDLTDAGCEVHVWRPCDFDEITRRLNRRTP